MEYDEPLLADVASTMPALPDDVWERALSIALDPATDATDDGLVPDMDDHLTVPDDEIVLYDDLDDGPDLTDDGAGHDIVDLADHDTAGHDTAGHDDGIDDVIDVGGGDTGIDVADDHSAPESFAPGFEHLDTGTDPDIDLL